MKLKVPISRKMLSTGIVSLVTLGLGKLGVYDLGAWLPWVTTGAGLTAGVVISEGRKYLRYAAERLNLPLEFEERA